MASEPCLRTQRLVLRRWRPQDREPFAAMNADTDPLLACNARPRRHVLYRLRRADWAPATIAAPRGS